MQAVKIPILIVEDDEFVKTVLSFVVQQVFPDAELLFASDGREAYDKLLNSDTKPRLMFLDLLMPHMDGLLFLTKLNQYEDLRSIPVVVISAAVDQPKFREGIKNLNCNILSVIAKPFYPDTLKKQLEEIKKQLFS